MNFSSNLSSYRSFLLQRSRVPSIDLLYGRKVYSQNDEDGIIEKLCFDLGIDNGVFLEFGTSDGLENNTHFLLDKGWSGTWVEADSSKAKLANFLFQDFISLGRLSISNLLACPDNKTTFFSILSSASPVDLLSVDIDGNDLNLVVSSVDYFKSSTISLPKIIVVEYNGKFGPYGSFECRADLFADQLKAASLYKDHMRGVGASLGCFIQSLRDYTLVACNITGVNAFFVRSDLLPFLDFVIPSLDDIYRPLDNRFWSSGEFDRQSGYSSYVVSRLLMLQNKKPR